MLAAGDCDRQDPERDGQEHQHGPAGHRRHWGAGDQLLAAGGDRTGEASVTLVGALGTFWCEGAGRLLLV